jgi:hypothetical protein
MYDFSKLNDNYPEGIKSHQQYFILRWGELLDESPLHFRKLLAPCSRAVLKEFLDVINLFHSGVLHAYNIPIMVKELIDTLKSDIVLKKFLSDDFNFIIDKLSSFLTNMPDTDTESKDGVLERITDKNLNYISSLVKSFLNKLESEDIIKIYTTHFKDCLSEEQYNYSSLDRELSLLVSELLYEGHSRSYLYRWGAGVFIYDKEKAPFLERVDRIGQLGRKNKRTFHCFLKVSLPKNNDFLYELTGNVRFFKDSNDAKVILEESMSNPLTSEINEYFDGDPNLKIGLVELKATDLNAALTQSANLLISRLSLFNLDKRSKSYTPSIKKNVVVYDVEGDNVELTSYGDESGIKIARTSEYLKILFSTSEEEYKTLHRLMGWLRIVQDSPKETGLVAMWSMMELLFVHDYAEKQRNVIVHTIPYISHFYVKSMVTRALTILESDSSKFEELKAKILDIYGAQAFTKDRKIKKEYFVEYINVNEAEVLKIYSDLYLHQRYIRLINSFTKIKKAEKKQIYVHLKEFIEELEQKITHDLRRAYRIRNILAHEASVHVDFFEDVYAKLTFYLQIILDDIFYSISRQNKNTIEQLVTIKRESYLLYMEYVNSLHKSLEKGESHLDKYERLINTRNLLI